MKVLFFIQLLLLTALNSQCQDGELDLGRISVGLKGGPGMTRLIVKQEESVFRSRAEWRLTYHAGIFARIPFDAEGRFSVQPEILYSRQGANFSQISMYTGNVDAYHQDMKYVNIPLMFQYTINSAIYLEAGPQMGFLLSARQEGPSTQEYDLEEQRTKQDISWGLGGGHISKNGFAFGFRYNQGIRDIIRNGNGSMELRNSAIFINFRYFFQPN